MKKIYISGKITGVPGFRDKFARVEKSLKLQGHVVFNPATLPAGLEYEEYMHIDLAMVAVSDTIYMLPCWKDSPGAIREKKFAESLGREVMYHEHVTGGTVKSKCDFFKGDCMESVCSRVPNHRTCPDKSPDTVGCIA